MLPRVFEPAARLYVAWGLLRRGPAGLARHAAARLLGRGPPRTYAEWIAVTERARRRATAHAPDAALHRDRGRVSLAIAAVPGEEALLDRTIASIAAQIHPAAEVVVAAPPGAWELAATAAAAGLVRRVEAPGEARGTLLEAALGATAGDLVGIVDPGDVLEPDALVALAAPFAAAPEADLAYADEDCAGEEGRRAVPLLKPSWSPEPLLATNYVGRPWIARRSVIAAVGGVADAPRGAEEYDLLLRLAERVRHVERVPGILAHRHRPTASDPAAAQEAVQRALARRGVDGRAEIGPNRLVRVRRSIPGEPLVSIVIPTRDRLDLLCACVETILERTRWRRFEIRVVDNGSRDPATLEYLARLPAPHRAMRHPGAFNWSALNDFAARDGRGDALLFLNNDVEVLADEWLEAMLEHALRPDVGAVGAKLLYPDGRVQHAGVLLGVRGAAGHAFRLAPGDDPGPLGMAAATREVSAVTGACLMTGRRVFERLGGFDERFRVAFGDVDYCLRARALGLATLVTPHARLFHHESATRRGEPPADAAAFRHRWGALVARGDPYHHPLIGADCEHAPWGQT